MVCQVCHRIGPGLCASCQGELVRPPVRILSGGLPLLAAFAHQGAAKRMVHDLKYRGATSYAELVARLLAPSLPRLPLVPVPRVWSRLLRYGVDPAAELALRLGRLAGVPVVRGLVRPIHQPRRAGGDHDLSIDYECLVPFSYSEVVLIDDVVTTGKTLLAASSALGAGKAAMAVAANVVLAPPTSKWVENGISSDS